MYPHPSGAFSQLGVNRGRNFRRLAGPLGSFWTDIWTEFLSLQNICTESAGVKAVVNIVSFLCSGTPGHRINFDLNLLPSFLKGECTVELLSWTPYWPIKSSLLLQWYQSNWFFTMTTYEDDLMYDKRRRLKHHQTVYTAQSSQTYPFLFWAY